MYRIFGWCVRNLGLDFYFEFIFFFNLVRCGQKLRRRDRELWLRIVVVVVVVFDTKDTKNEHIGKVIDFRQVLALNN